MERSKNVSGYERFNKLLGELPEKHKSYLQLLFHNAPLWLFDEMEFVSIDKDRTFICEGEPVNHAFIFVSGSVRAIDYRIMNIEYNYMSFHPVTMFGSMELLNNMDVYQTTLVAETSCNMICIPANIFMQWMKSDGDALLLEAGSIIAYLLEQARTDRIFLFAQGMERVALLMVKEYERNMERESCTINFSRKEWSNRTGLSMKTVDRTIQAMAEEHLVEKTRGGLRFGFSQYQKMKAYLSEKIAEF